MSCQVKQSWVPLQGNQLKIPEELKQMLKVAKEFNVEIQARKCSMELKGKMMIWYHMTKPKENYKWNKKVSICLRLSHGIGMMSELKDFVDEGVERAQVECDQGKTCMKMAEGLLGMIQEK